MDRFFNSNRQSMTSYLDIFKACRLCGSGGGYKMPIIQKINNDDVIDVEAELKEKIKECVSIEVNRDDRMPPLICELCVDKVNDFYEFREMCRATNARVRASLGLPPQTLSQDVNEDCILGVSGPVFHSSKEADRPPTPKVAKKDAKNNAKKPQLNIAKNMLEKRQTRNTPVVPPPTLLAERTSRRRQAESPAPVHVTKKLRFASPARPASPAPELKRRSDKSRRSTELVPEVKSKVSDAKTRLSDGKSRLSDGKSKLSDGKTKLSEVKSKLLDAKKAKEIPLAAPERKGREVRESPLKVKEVPVKVKEVPKKKEVVYPFKCEICAAGFMKLLPYKQHQVAIHTANVIPEKMSCIPCRKWFVTAKETEAHHRWHRSSGSYYQCHRCSTDFKVLMGFTKHFQLKQCMPWTVVPDVPCPVCLKTFATETWMGQHKCPGPPPPPPPPPVPDKCSKCPNTYTSRIQLKRHEKICKGVPVEVNPNNPHLGDLRDLSISVDRCDDLLMRIKTEPGLVFTPADIKSEPRDFEEESHTEPTYIKQEIKQEYNEFDNDYNDNGFGDNYSSNESETANNAPIPRPNLVRNPFARKSVSQVDSLSVISLRSIFSTKLFKKKSKNKKKKKQRPNPMSAFDALIVKSEPMDAPENEFDHMESDVPMNDAPLDAQSINDIIGTQTNEARVNETNDAPEASKANADETAEGRETGAVNADETNEASETDKAKADETNEGQENSAANADGINEDREASKAIADETNEGQDASKASADETKESQVVGEANRDLGEGEEKMNEGDTLTTAPDMFENDKSEEETNNFGFDIQMAVDEVEKSLNNTENPANDSETMDESLKDKENAKSVAVPEEEAKLVMETLLGQVDQSLEKDLEVETAKSVETVKDPSSAEDSLTFKENSVSTECTQEELDKKELDEIINEIKEAELTEGRSVKTGLLKVVTYSEDSCSQGKSMEEACGLDPEVAAMLDEDDIDSEINSVLQGELSPFIMQKREVKISLEVEETPVKNTDAAVGKETEESDVKTDAVVGKDSEESDVKTNADADKPTEETDVNTIDADIGKETVDSDVTSMDTDVGKTEERDVKTIDADVGKETESFVKVVEKEVVKESSGGDSQDVREDSLLESVVEEVTGTDLNESASQIEDIIKQDGANKTDEDANNLKLGQAGLKTGENKEVELKSEEELNKLESEGDVMDLISDSGDDCNIVDSPEKTKALDDQLLDADLLEESNEATKNKYEDDALEEERLLQDDPMDATEPNLIETNPSVSIPTDSSIELNLADSKPMELDLVDSNALDSLGLDTIDTNPIESRESEAIRDNLMDVSLSEVQPQVVSAVGDFLTDPSDHLASEPDVKSNSVQSVVQEHSVIRSVEDYKKLAVSSVIPEDVRMDAISDESNAIPDDVGLDAISDDDFDMDS